MRCSAIVKNTAFIYVHLHRSQKPVLDFSFDHRMLPREFWSELLNDVIAPNYNLSLDPIATVKSVTDKIQVHLPKDIQLMPVANDNVEDEYANV